jgi:putative membrane-bound dehydrogenase-like protein
MKRLLVLLPLIAFAAAAPVPLFDAKTLDGWESREPSLWKVEDGCLTGGGVPKIPHNDFLCTKRSFSNFVLKLKIKLTGDPTTGMINSGIQIRTMRNPSGHEVCGYQCDYGEPGWYGGIYDEGRRNKFIAPADMAVLHPAIKLWDWNEYVIRAEGNRIQTWINGVPGVDYKEEDPNIPQDGILGIQVHAGGNTKAQVKDVTIEELPPTPNAPTWEKLGGVEGVRAKLAPPKKGADAAPAGKRDISYNTVASAAKTPDEERALLKVPDGFEVELVAAESEGVGKFVPLVFDQHGALWTTTAFEYPVDGNENPAAAEALYASHAKDKVLVFDRDPKSPTGLSSKPRVFADGLAIPLGVLPYKNGCYVLHGHDIAFLEDTDADGKADKRTVILTGFGVQDSHLFPHQFTRAPGGWIWMAQGAFNYSKVRRPSDPPERAVQFDQTRMAKFRPDGSGFDITSNGPCNIWGLVLNGEGEAFIQEANDFGYPVMPFHEYANYPGCSDRQWKSYAPEFPGTAPDFRMGGTGLSGLALLDAGWVALLEKGSAQSPVLSAQSEHASAAKLSTEHLALSTSSQTVLIANPITNRIQGIKMHRDGPRWRLDPPQDFLVSADPWFRPVAITVGPDGCLYIVDWYNKIISHNEVPRNHPDRDKTRGRIWRVKAKAAKPFDVPDFTKLSGDELSAKLGGDSLAQSHLAWQAIGDRGMKELAPRLREILAETGGASTPLANRRIAALWALRGLEDVVPGSFVEVLSVTDPNRNVRREALAAAVIPTLPAWQSADPFLDPDPEVRAEFVRKLGSRMTGEIGDLNAIGMLLRLDVAPRAEPVAPSTRNGKPIKVREAYDREFERYLVRMFLEQHPDAVAKFLDSDEAKRLTLESCLLASLALEPKASAARVAKLLPQLQRAPGQEEVLRLAQFPDEPGVGEALRDALNNPATRTGVLESLLATRTRLDSARLTPFLADAAKQLLADPAGAQLGAQLAGGFQLAAAEPQLVSLVTGSGGAAMLPALRALASIGSVQSDLFAKLAETSADPLLRDEALTALASSRAADAPARVLALYPKLAATQRRLALDRLAGTKAGAKAVVVALRDGKLDRDTLDAAVLDRLQAVLGERDPDLAALLPQLAHLFRPVLALDGSDDAWFQTDLSLDGPLTVETWVRLDGEASNADGILGAPEQLDLNFFGGKFRVFTFAPLRDVAVAKKAITPGQWTHVAATRDANGIWRIYYDGMLDATATQPAPRKLENLRIGWSSAKGGLQGALGEFRIWNRERTASEILANFDRTLEDQPAGLVFRANGGEGWGKLAKGTKVMRTTEFPPLLTADEAKMLDAKFAKYGALAAHAGDAARGKQVAAICQACHLFGTTGGNIGPNLSGVGAMGTEAILRNILTPNAAMESAYRIYRVEQRDGTVLDAFFVSEDKDAVVVRSPGAEDRRIAKKDIVKTQFIRRSLMPEGLLDAMTPEQVSDLFAFLKTMR